MPESFIQGHPELAPSAPLISSKLLEIRGLSCNSPAMITLFSQKNNLIEICPLSRSAAFRGMADGKDRHQLKLLRRTADLSHILLDRLLKP